MATRGKNDATRLLRVGTLAESANAANEIRDARLDAMEKRIGDLETRCHVLLNGLESERRQRAIDRTSVRAGKRTRKLQKRMRNSRRGVGETGVDDGDGNESNESDDGEVARGWKRL